MTKLIGEELSDELYQRLRGEDLEQYAEKVILISTVDEKGWPHPAVLSYLEVVAKDRRNIRLATYKHSGTTNNMRRRGKATLSIIDERLVYYVKGSVEELSEEMTCAPHNAKLNMRVEQVLADQANKQLEAGAYVASGVMYKNSNLAAEILVGKEILAELLSDHPA